MKQIKYNKQTARAIFTDIEKLSAKYKRLVDEEQHYADELLIFLTDYKRLKEKVLR